MMTEPNAQRSIGRLEGKLDALIATVQEQGERSDASRARLYERLDQVAVEQQRADMVMKGLEAKVDRIEPFATDFANLKQRGLALAAVAALIWTLVGGALVNGFGSFLSWASKAVSQS